MNTIRWIVVLLVAVMAMPSAMAAKRRRSSDRVERDVDKEKPRATRKVRKRTRATVGERSRRRVRHGHARRHAQPVVAAQPIPEQAPVPAQPQGTESDEHPLAAIDRRIDRLQAAVAQAQQRMDDLKNDLLNPKATTPGVAPRGSAGPSAPSI